MTSPNGYPPGPGAAGSLRVMLGLHHDPTGVLAGLQRRHGDLVHFRIGPQHVFVVLRADLIREVLVNHQKSFKKGPGFERARIVLGDGLLTSEGEFHLRQRRMLQPAFHRRRVAAYGDIMVEEAAQLGDRWQDGEVRDIAADMGELTLRVVTRALFGADVDERAGDIGHAVAEAGGFFDYLTIALFPVLLRTPLPRVRRFLRAIDELEQATDGVIAARRAHPEARDGDLLSILLEARDTEGDGAGMTDKQVRDEALTLITAGHETTANGLNWAWYVLALHPEAEARFHAELDAVLDGRPPSAEDAASLVYTHAMMLEAMRLYPPAWGIERRALRDQAIGGYVIPAGAAVLMPTFVINRDRRLYPDPLRFEPARFLPEASAGRPDWAYPLFGAGTRKCIGYGFAMLESVLVLAELGRRWRLKLGAGQTVTPQARVSLRPRDGLWMRLERRG
ncbi:MAG: cytochrome P450 [Gaiellales bacterium]